MAFRMLNTDTLIKIFATLTPEKIEEILSDVELNQLYNNEEFLAQLITTKYKVNLAKVPGNTMLEKYRFMSMFEAKNFPGLSTDQILDRVSRILKDAKELDLTTLEWTDASRTAMISRNLHKTLEYAFLTRSPKFIKMIIDILVSRIHPDYIITHYSRSFRASFITSIVLGFSDITNTLAQYYDYRKDSEFPMLLRQASHVYKNMKTFKNLEPYITLIPEDFWALLSKKRFALAEYVYGKLTQRGINPFADALGVTDEYSAAIANGDVDTIKFMLKYVDPPQESIDFAMELGKEDLLAILLRKE